MASLPTKTATLAALGLYPALVAHRQNLVAEEKSNGPSTTSAPPPIRSDELIAQRQKLSIYDTATNPATLLPVESPFQQEVAQARRWLQSSYAQMHAHTREGARTWIGWETRAEEQVKSLIAADEDLTPGAVYVGIATLTGSIIARNRNIILRVALPPTFFAIALTQFLPKTASIVGARAEQFERTYLPELQKIRKKVI